MKRTLIVGIAVVMAVGIAGPSPARSQRTRWVQTQEYGQPAAVGADTDLPGILVGSVRFEPETAKSVRITVEDTAAPATLVKISQGSTNLGVFCTSSDPLKIKPQTPIEVDLYAGSCGGSPAFITAGVVHAEFARR